MHVGPGLAIQSSILRRHIPTVVLPCWRVGVLACPHFLRAVHCARRPSLDELSFSTVDVDGAPDRAEIAARLPLCASHRMALDAKCYP